MALRAYALLALLLFLALLLGSGGALVLLVLLALLLVSRRGSRDVKPPAAGDRTGVDLEVVDHVQAPGTVRVGPVEAREARAVRAQRRRGREGKAVHRSRSPGSFLGPLEPPADPWVRNYC